jgi:hypothetical protein
MAKLSGRLQQLRELRGQREEKIPAEEQRGIFPERNQPPWLLENWKQTETCVWQRSVELALERREIKLSGILLGGFRRLLELTFYDFETTGLSGGAGTLIFLAGFGVLEGEKLRVEQILLTDYPGEAAFLERMRPFLDENKLFVSYNGKSFDRNILLNRMRMRGLREGMPRQLDLLYPARRLWSRVLEGCGLQQIERSVLGIERNGDIGGALIPLCYQEFLRGKGGACMQSVVEHHLRDILSLAELLFFIEAMPEDSGSFRFREEKTGIGSILLSRGDPRAIAYLEEALLEGDERAGRYLTGYYKREKRSEDLERVLERMLGIRAGFFQVTEMAKFLEHQRKEPVLALELLSSFPQPKARLTSCQYENLCRRRKRLRKKTEL